MRLKNRVAIVTGGGMGRGISNCLSRDGAHVVVADLNLESAQATVEVVEKNNRQGLALVTDVASEEACRSLVAGVGGVWADRYYRQQPRAWSLCGYH